MLLTGVCVFGTITGVLVGVIVFCVGKTKSTLVPPLESIDIFGILMFVSVAVFVTVSGAIGSVPIGANGFGLPSLPSGTSSIVEFCNVLL